MEMRNIILPLVLAACLTSCVTQQATTTVPQTWEQAVAVATSKANAGKYSYIIKNMLAPEYINNLAMEYGSSEWSKKFQKAKLEKLPYFYGWLKGGKVIKQGNQTLILGQFGCYANFIKIDGKCLISDFGQNITSM